MYKGKTIAVVVPAYNEENQIGLVIETMPDFVDRIIIVNDNSTDRTSEIVQEYIRMMGNMKLPEKRGYENNNDRYNKAELFRRKKNIEEIRVFPPSEICNPNMDNKVILINNLVNTGVGGAISRGYKWCKDYNIDCTAVMAGDGQMDPSELESIISPVVNEEVDYVKGNRLLHNSAWEIVPFVRFLGNSVLSILTKLASGYWHVSDTQTGYTAISNKALHAIRLHKIYKSYGMPNDLLVRLNIAFCTIKEVEIKPIYDIGEKSKMKVWKVIPKISWLLFKSFFKRLWIKYLFKNFHPLFLLYHLSFLLLGLSIPVIVTSLPQMFIKGEYVSNKMMFIMLFLLISGFQSLFFAMWMDIQDNERLYK